MKKLIIFTFLLVFFTMIQANNLNLQLQGNDFGGFFNSIRASAIDVDNPNNQPIIFRMNINRTGSDIVTEAYMHFSLTWNGNAIITNSRSEFTESSLQYLNQNVTLNLSNRDLIRNAGSQYLKAAVPSLSLSDFLNNRHFKTSIMNTGLFPDGVYSFTMQIKTDNGQSLSGEPSVFNMTVSNVYNISLISPGSIAGSSIPEVSGQPLVFLWNSNIINSNNPYTLTIREYTHESSINISNLEGSGRLFYSSSHALMSPLFNESLPFINGNYYAWNISMPVVTDQTEFGINSRFSSSWNIFKFVVATGDAPNPYQNISTFLNNLQHPLVNQLLQQGVVPTGNFYHNGNSVSYPQALNILQQLLNSEIVSIQIVD